MATIIWINLVRKVAFVRLTSCDFFQKAFPKLAHTYAHWTVPILPTVDSQNSLELPLRDISLIHFFLVVGAAVFCTTGLDFQKADHTLFFEKHSGLLSWIHKPQPAQGTYWLTCVRPCRVVKGSKAHILKLSLSYKRQFPPPCLDANSGDVQASDGIFYWVVVIVKRIS